MLDYVWSRLYARWLRRELVRPRPSITLRHGTGRNLILGIGRNYSPADLRPFVRSARRFHDCRIVLVIGDDPEVAKALEAEGVDCVSDPGSSGLGRPHMNFARVADYIAVLQGLSDQIDRVFLADTRDVVFQRDVFATLPDVPLIFVEESQGFSLAVAGWNGNAIRRTFGADVFARISNREVICSGTVLGRHQDAIVYCWQKLLLGQMVGREHHMRSGVDQATTNVAVRLNLVPSSIVLPYDGEIATLSGPNSNFISVKDGLLVSERGAVPAVVHQYDRVRDVRDFVYSQYGGPESGKAGERSKGSKFGRKMRIACGLQGP